MVEGGRIDHVLHATNARGVLQEIVAFDDAIKVTLDKIQVVDPGSKNILIEVTANYNYTMGFNGYPKLRNPILGKVSNYQDSKLALAASACGKASWSEASFLGAIQSVVPRLGS